jgi:hypothetical protein
VPSVYIASKALHAEWWRALRAAGLPIVASWIDAEINRTDAEPSADQWARHWETCVSEASGCDIVLLYAAEGETQCGSLIEIGAALASGKRVYIVSPYTWTVAHHPRCRMFPSLPAAVEAIVAMQAGERLRSAA